MIFQPPAPQKLWGRGCNHRTFLIGQFCNLQPKYQLDFMFFVADSGLFVLEDGQILQTDGHMDDKLAPTLAQLTLKPVGIATSTRHDQVF